MTTPLGSGSGERRERGETAADAATRRPVAGLGLRARSGRAVAPPETAALGAPRPEEDRDRGLPGSPSGEEAQEGAVAGALAAARARMSPRDRRERGSRRAGGGPGASPRLLLAATGWLTVLAVTQLPAGFPLRLAVVGAFLLLAPGAALQLPLRPALSGKRRLVDRAAATAEQWMIAVMLSLSALVLVAVGLMLARSFSPLTTLVVLAVITTVAALLPAARDRTTGS